MVDIYDDSKVSDRKWKGLNKLKEALEKIKKLTMLTI